MSGSERLSVVGGVVGRGQTKNRSCSDPAEAEKEVGTALIEAAAVGGNTDRVKPLDGAWICCATMAGSAVVADFVARFEVDSEAGNFSADPEETSDSLFFPFRSCPTLLIICGGFGDAPTF